MRAEDGRSGWDAGNDTLDDSAVATGGRTVVSGGAGTDVADGESTFAGPVRLPRGAGEDQGPSRPRL